MAEASLDMRRAALASAGLARLEGRAGRFAKAILHFGAKEQIFYAAMMEAFGYSANTEGFNRLAYLLPWREIPRNPAEALAALHGAAMLVEWKRFGVRPANWPEKRFGAAARLCSDIPGLLNALAACDWSCKKGVKEALGILCGEAWRGDFDARLGKGRAAAMAASVVYPFLRATRRIPKASWLPVEDLPLAARETAHRLFGRDHSPSIYNVNGLYVQGLLHIAKDFCAKMRPSCKGCVFMDSNLLYESKN